MNETFIRKNDLGVDIEYTIVAKYNSEEREYIIYTDFVSDPKYVYRLFVDMVNGNKYIPLSENGQKEILNKCKEQIKAYLDYCSK